MTSNSLNAYYVFIHPYFPIFPSPISSPAVDRPLSSSSGETMSRRLSQVTDYEPSSPISLAILAILTLIPLPGDTNSSTPESLLARRECAQSYALSTMESIEVESELLDSATSPSCALKNGSPAILRQPLHPRVPAEIESVLALLILSIYEYAQRGNISKMRNRAGQALVSAMNMSLHSRGDEDDEFAEARRRAWWMTVSTS